MNLTTRERIEKGLDRDGLIKAWDNLSEHTSYVRGLILVEAKEVCSRSDYTWDEFIKSFKIDGKSITTKYSFMLIRKSNDEAELRKLSESKVDLTFLDETEATLTLPKSNGAYAELRGDNAVQKAKNYLEVKETLGKEEVGSREIRAFNTAKREAKKESEEKWSKIEDKHKLPKRLPKPDPFTTEEEVDFETWCKTEHGIDIYADKPKGSNAIYALKDDNVQRLYARLDEWKPAYKIMVKLCHPDTGGNSLAMSFLGDIKGLMSSLQDIKKVIDFDEKIKLLREEYSTPKLR